MRDVREDAPVEVALRVEPAFDKPGDNRLTREWCVRLLDMYRAWAAKRNMQLTEIAGERAGDPPLLLISGFGAHRCLSVEIGLHVLDLAEDDKRGSRGRRRASPLRSPRSATCRSPGCAAASCRPCSSSPGRRPSSAATGPIPRSWSAT